MSIIKKSRRLSYILRHKPSSVGIILDAHGWANTSELCVKMPITMLELEEIVRTDSKGRFSFSEDKTRLRANQGHSIQVDVELKECTPPEFLYHGTATKSLESICKEGLKKMNRLHVHLSADVNTAIAVGSRHGAVVVCRVQALRMFEKGHKFWLSENGVWLTDHVPLNDLEVGCTS
jgi:putative RNA 2'-phosphotransferase